jgi:murein DD-endopeptidase MepM/ murein hydrolase activator NlpD
LKKRDEMPPARILAVVTATLGLSFGVVFAGSTSQKLEAKPTQILQGDIAELRVSGTGLISVEGRIGKETIRFYPAGREIYSALIGVDLQAKPGLTKILLRATTRNGGHREGQITLNIKPKKFQEESFSVPQEFDQFSPDVLERIRLDQERFARAFTISVSERLWEAQFIRPAQADISSPFGYRRVINGTPRAPHTGVDLRVPTGTEVLASNRGRIVLVGDFFFSGNSVVIDHGGGLHTMYFHLSEIKVVEGAEVHKGEVIGLSGMTGRVSGPHLHWAARLNGARIDPFELLKKLGGASHGDLHPIVE